MNITDVLLFASDEDPSMLRNALRTAGTSPQLGETLSSLLYICDKTGIHPDNNIL